MPIEARSAMPKVHQTGAAGGRRGRGARVATSLAEINVVPLVDVMLVLLIIFMVTAPMMQQGLEVNLPQARRADPINAQPVYVTVPADFRAAPVRAARRGGRPARHPAGARAAGDPARATTSRCSSACDGAASVQDLLDRDRQAEGSRRREGRADVERPMEGRR